MILIVGGQGAGKRQYAVSLGYDARSFSSALDANPVLTDLHILLKTMLSEQNGIPHIDDTILAALLDKDIVICNEVGCGVVPMDAADRAWRDFVGRTCTLLAERAEKVVRVCCGIPSCLKGDDV